MKKITTLVLSLALLVTLYSCKPNDEKIGEAVKMALSSNAALSPVSATVKDGVVTISGEVESDELKALAESALSGVEGLKSVVNKCNSKA